MTMTVTMTCEPIAPPVHPATAKPGQGERRGRRSGFRPHMARASGIAHRAILTGLLLLLCAAPALGQSIDAAAREGDIDTVRQLLDEDAGRLEPGNENAWTPLQRAAAAGHDELVEFLLERGAEIDRQRWSRSALYYAADENQPAVVATLIEHGSDVNQIVAHDRQVIHVAAEAGHTKVIELLAAGGADVDARTGDGGTALHDAAAHDHADAAAWLIDNGADLDAQDRWGRTPLHRSMRRGHDVAGLLIDAESDFTLRTDHGTTALHSAAIWDNARAVDRLLEVGAEVDARANDGGTPLDRAARRGHDRAAERLIAAGADVNASTDQGWKPLHHAASIGADELASALLDAGATLEARLDDGRTALYLAVEHDQPHVASTLLEHGADVDVKLDDDVSALLRAAERRGGGLATLLIEHGADVHHADQWQRTALHRAARRGENDTVRTLLEHGANVDAADDDGFRPLDLAQIGRHHATADLLIEHGADEQRTRRAEAARVTVDAEAAVGYLRAARKPNGAFGPHENTYTDVGWNYPAVASLLMLEATIDAPEDALAAGDDWIWTFGAGAKFFQLHMRARLHALLGSTLREADDVRRDAWELVYKPVDDISNHVGVDADFNHAQKQFHNVSAAWYSVKAAHDMAGTVSNADDVEAFLIERQAGSGAFVEDFDPELGVESAVEHVVFTAHAVRALRALGRSVPDRDAVVAWLQSCQDEAGGFRRAPLEQMGEFETEADYQPDVWYTFEALAALDALDAGPRDPEAAIDWLNSLQNHDGGFGDQPGWRSRLMSTYWALRGLGLLTGDARGAIRATTASEPVREPILEGKYDIYHANHQTPFGGPEMVDAIDEMGYDLVGITRGNQMGAARSYLKETGRRSPHLHAVYEEQGHRVRYLGEFLGHHVANIFYPYEGELNPERRSAWRSTWRAIRPLSREGFDWPEYRERVLMPIVDIGGLFMPEQEWEMAFSYMSFQDGEDLRAGYNIVHTAHFNGPDRIRAMPYRERHITRIGAVADTDSHGDVEEWRENLEGYRTLYLARTPALDDYLDAVLHGRAVTVIRDDVPGGLTYYGRPEVVEYVKGRIEQWRWWE